MSTCTSFSEGEEDPFYRVSFGVFFPYDAKAAMEIQLVKDALAEVPHNDVSYKITEDLSGGYFVFDRRLSVMIHGHSQIEPQRMIDLELLNPDRVRALTELFEEIVIPYAGDKKKITCGWTIVEEFDEDTESL
jgi:hypothetical protein